MVNEREVAVQMRTTKPNHTAGPWRAKTSRAIVAARGHTNIHGETDHYEGDIAWTQPVPTREGGERVRLANAWLIAAAPDLLAALETIVSEAPLADDMLNLALAAITRANGGTA